MTFEGSTNVGIYDESLDFVLPLTQFFMFQLLMKKPGQAEKSFPIASCNPEAVIDTEAGVGLVSIGPQVDDRLSVCSKAGEKGMAALQHINSMRLGWSERRANPGGGAGSFLPGGWGL